MATTNQRKKSTAKKRKETKYQKTIRIITFLVIFTMALVGVYYEWQAGTLWETVQAGISGSSVAQSTGTNHNTPLSTGQETDFAAAGTTRVHVIDVGQGDSLLYEQNGHYALIDAGTADSRPAILAY
ncbi:MAG: hypothetical protein PHG02_05340 [Oscillospiraceae bacterium]|nr:hypothetical protein [Oscillospiraceae bacterium]